MEKYNRLTQAATLVVLGLMGLSCSRMEVTDPCPSRPMTV